METVIKKPTRAPFWGILLFVCLFCRPPAQGGTDYNEELLYRSSLEHFNQGRLEQAMVGFMDIIVENPGNRQAKDYLRRAAEKMLEGKKKDFDSERHGLVSQTRRIKQELDALLAEKRLRKSQWESLIKNTADVISKCAAAEEAMDAYSGAVRKTPIYSDGKADYESGIKPLRAHLFKRLKKEAPFIIKTEIAEKLVNAEFQPKNPRMAPAVLADAYRRMFEKLITFSRMEMQVQSLLSLSEEAFLKYTQEKYSDSLELWEQVRKIDSANSEAAFYVSRINGRLSETRLAFMTEEDLAGIIAAATVSTEPYPGPSLQMPIPGAPEKNGEVQAAQPADKTAEKTGVRQAALTDKIKSEADNLYTQGLQAYALGNIETAVAIWRKCLELNPGHSRALKALKRGEKELK